MKYLNIILSNKSVFPCCTWAENSDVLTKKNLVEGIEFAITNKLVINVFYPEENISEDIQNLLSTVSHNRIIPNSLKCQKGDIVIIDGWNHFLSINFLPDVTYIVKTTRQDLSENWKHLPFYKNIRIDIKVIDIEGMKDDDFAKYHTVLANMAEAMVDAYATGVFMQCNLLTDRVSLTSMRNCGAGDTHITLAPNGSFYVCPAFYFGGNGSIGNISVDLDIKNQQLYTIAYAPICMHCDAFHCKRCIWLNKKLTLEVNTPSREQCITAHIERNATRQLCLQAEDKGKYSVFDIPDLPYLDPFEQRLNWLK